MSDTKVLPFRPRQSEPRPPDPLAGLDDRERSNIVQLVDCLRGVDVAERAVRAATAAAPAILSSAIAARVLLQDGRRCAWRTLEPRPFQVLPRVGEYIDHAVELGEYVDRFSPSTATRRAGVDRGDDREHVLYRVVAVHHPEDATDGPVQVFAVYVGLAADVIRKGWRGGAA